MFKKTLLGVAAAAAIAAGTLPAAPAHASAPPGAPDPTRAAVITGWDRTMALLDVSPQWTGSTATCQAGTTAPQFFDATLATMNYVRNLAGLAPVTSSPELNANAQAVALLRDATTSLTTPPPPTSACWTADANTGVSQSLTALTAGPAAVLSYVAEDGPDNTTAGHRRWLLYPGLRTIGIGNTSTANAINVLGAPLTDPAAAWTTWPAAGYFPAGLEPQGRWSASWPGADFSHATVTATVNGAPVVTTVAPVVAGYGANTLVFDLPVPPSDTDQSITVKLTGAVDPSGQPLTHTWTTILVPTPVHVAGGYGLRIRRDSGGLLAYWNARASEVGATYTVVVQPTVKGQGTPAKCVTAERSCHLRVKGKHAYTAHLVTTLAGQQVRGPAVPVSALARHRS